MTGIMAAIAGTGQNVIYGSGLYSVVRGGYAGGNTAYFNTGTSPVGPDTSPIQVGYSNTDISQQWIGYFRPTITGTLTFGVQTTGSNFSSYNYLWVGEKARTTFSSGNADITGFNGLTSASISGFTAGLYYPIRIQFAYLDTAGAFQSSNCTFTFLVQGTSSIGTTVFYNTLTSGF